MRHNVHYHQRGEANRQEKAPRGVLHTGWYKRAFRTLLGTALRDHPELLAGLDFGGTTKREVADEASHLLVLA